MTDRHFPAVSRLLLWPYFLLLIRFIIFKYPLSCLLETAGRWSPEEIRQGMRTANLTPFRTIHMYIRYRHSLNSLENLAGNLAAFIPLGILLPLADRRFASVGCILVNALVLSAGMEAFQLLSTFGAFDVDDILLNCAGAAAGYMLCALTAGTAGKIMKKRL